jgi:hypothetical protein
MKKKLFVFLMLVVSLPMFAQEQDGEDVGWVARFGAAGGFTPIYVVPNINPLNDLVRKFGIEEFSTSGMVTWGGSGYAYIMMVDNLRIGGMGISGTMNTTGSIGGLDKEVVYNYGLGGLTVEYTLPFINRIAVSVGSIIGVGSSSMEFYKNKGSINWSDIIDKSNDENESRKYTNTFFTLAPTLNVDVPLSRFMAVRVGCGYVFSFNNGWKVDNDKTLNAVPSDMKSNSFFIQTGIFLGLFAF